MTPFLVQNFLDLILDTKRTVVKSNFSKRLSLSVSLKIKRENPHFENVIRKYVVILSETWKVDTSKANLLNSWIIHNSVQNIGKPLGTLGDNCFR